MAEQLGISAGNPAPAPTIGPVLPGERIEVIDILRGWAIFGILLVNISHDVGWDYLLAKQWQGTVDRIAWTLVDIFGSGKFYTLFSFLFGLGFALQMGRAESRGAPFFPVYRRRLLALFLIALVHTLIWWGDVLLHYAVLGFLLLLFRTRSPRLILATAFVCLLIPLVYVGAVDGNRTRRLADPQTAQEAMREAGQRQAKRRAWNDQDLRVHSRGSFREIVIERAQQFTRRHTQLHWSLSSASTATGYDSTERYAYWLGGWFPFLLLGLYAGRRGIFQDLRAHLPFIRKVMWWGLGLGVVCAPAAHIVSEHLPNPAWPYVTRHLADVLWTIGAPALCFFYASTIVLLAQKEGWKRRLAPLATVGRLALSNYLFQSLVQVLIFNSYGLGLYGKVGPLGGVALTFLIFPVQVVLSIWWIRRFRFGPAEWLWRTLTYGKLQPMRLAAKA